MPVLFLDYGCQLEQDNEDAAVVCAPRPQVSPGSFARLEIDPAQPHMAWRAVPLEGVPFTFDDSPNPLLAYLQLAPGIYVAHSAFRTRRAMEVFVEVMPDHQIRVLCQHRDEDLVLAALHGVSLEQHLAARDAAESALETVPASVPPGPPAATPDNPSAAGPRAQPAKDDPIGTAVAPAAKALQAARRARRTYDPSDI